MSRSFQFVFWPPTFVGLFLEARAFDTYAVLKAGTSLANYLDRISGK